MKYSILIVEDEKMQRESLFGFFKKSGADVYKAATGNEALEMIKEKQIDIVLTDYRMPDMNGIDVLKKCKLLNPEIQVIMMTAFGTIEMAVEAMRLGAFHYLQKPVNLEELEILLERALNLRLLVSENKQLKEQLKGKFIFEKIIYKSREIDEALNIAARVAPSHAPVLLRGESGTGKELFAKAIHLASEKKEEPFIVVNCAAMPETLLESEMFGYEKGAFTGADQKRIGRFEEAGKGTIFIDEIGDIPPMTQVKLLRVLQSGEYSRLGSNQILKNEARIITATNRNLEEMIKLKLFREDFFYRINVVPIYIPPLRSRRTDIPLLIEHFLNKYGSGKQFSREAMDALLKYDYPGNVRELENIVHRAAVLSRGNVIGAADLPWELTDELSKHSGNYITPSPEDLNGQIENLERLIIRLALQETGGNQSKAARLLKISERNLRYKLERLKLVDIDANERQN